MKNLKYVVGILCIGAIIASCGDNSNKGTNELKNTVEAVNDAKKVINDATSIQESEEELRKKIPLTKDQYRTWLPENLLDLSLTSTRLDIGQGNGICSATYGKGNRRIQVMIIDGAGERGPGNVSTYRMAVNMELNMENENSYTKSSEIAGIKVKEGYNKTADIYSLMMFYGERFAVDIKTHEIEHEQLEQMVEELNLEELSSL
ncbi:hypothetical protein ESY86_15595 [Subsaximicrobium wynnwilliamsii]|uniref:Lipoprotein n=1 Tax=Subsaximicrobium wynnwilliamsii TaxID=291179 RepID=A0A5C6ZFU8_9FLAO|nr:hypothetical protein [Subsaximicrobium wynnwilliamsii]TXD82091.1 hypothetical protein ESY87_15185 [Subsaximicrobium wynnwilliamsii]TXD87736.1 hypothetical protein ESY86_15595 [Subsaximicrobium wynnwilliamsii]TXE01547.1 hypothetical protein ESY88_15175 [Subsaximicrobium wynnwilliamsii]